MNHIAIIMAGGRGTRLWPLSTPECPKQFISLSGGLSLIQETIQRLEGLYDNRHIFIVTNRHYAKHIDQQCPQIPVENIFYEPCGRNTAPCIALVSLIVKKRYGADATTTILSSDAAITKPQQFREVLKQATLFAAENRRLITVGITPTAPETGYGYIKTLPGDHSIKPVDKFVEKPDLATAERYLADGSYFWNAGMFVWRVDQIIEEMNKYFASSLGVLMPLLDVPQAEEQNFLDQNFAHCESLSIDYAIMEKSDCVSCIPGDIGWNDIGSWRALDQLLPIVGNNHALSPAVVDIDAASNIIFSPKKMVALIGVQDLIVVETDDAILVCHKDAAQNVKQAVDKAHVLTHNDSTE